MNDTESANRTEARQSFSGRGLTESQFDKAWAIAAIVEREIQRSGSFREPLTDYAHAFARNERFDAMKAEEIIRDIFKGRYGQTMNALRETLGKKGEDVRDQLLDKAHDQACQVVELVRESADMPFFRAYDQVANRLARDNGITEIMAKEVMTQAYANREGRELYDAGKEAETSRKVEHSKGEQVAGKPRRRKPQSKVGPSR